MTGAAIAPTIETERLRLRSFRPEDLEPQAAMLADPEVVRHLGGYVHSREESWRRMIASPGMWVMLGYGYWAVERRADGVMIGQVGFGDFKREMVPSIEGLPEMGWVFATSGQGQGCALEAVSAALAWADEAGIGEQYTAIIAPGNDRSARLAGKVGFVKGPDALYRDEPIWLFRRPAETVAAGGTPRTGLAAL